MRKSRRESVGECGERERESREGDKIGMKNAEMEMKKWMGMRVVTEVSLTVRERMRQRVVCREMSMMFDEKEPSPGVRRLVEEISEYYGDCERREGGS